LVQLPTGETQQIAIVDLDTLLAVAEQNPDFAAALQQAFNAALGTDARGQLLDGVDGADAGPALQQIAIATATDGAIDADGDGRERIASLFRGLVGALQPAAQKAATNTEQAQQGELAAEAGAEGETKATLDLRSAEALRQSKDLTRALGDEMKIEVKVVVDGQPSGRVGFQWSKYNPFAGYNPADMRVENIANGMAGTGLGEPVVDDAVIASPEPRTASPWTSVAPRLAALDPNAGSLARSQTGAGAVRAEGAPSQAIERPAGTNPQQNQSSNNSFAGLMSQNATTQVARTKAADQPAPTTPQEVIEQIKVNITRAAKAGVDRVTIQLKPEELGRIEVTLEMSQDGKVKATIAAENPATLELLKADARGMERALQDAGLRASAEDLEFNLRGQDSEKLADDRGRAPERDLGRGAAEEAANDDIAEDQQNYDYARAARLRGGVDTYA
ncbi:MAG: hypothetical protein FJX59_17405, partial [Alphaproteobacteria bacterium]|nr:hypothetical protein [Alphaproteobacteria bacterium]